jgi:hypothetical protein
MITSGWRILVLFRSFLGLTHSSVSTPSARSTNRGLPDSFSRTQYASVTLCGSHSRIAAWCVILVTPTR